MAQTGRQAASLHPSLQSVADLKGLWLLTNGPFSVFPHACVLNHVSHVPLFATLWTIALQAPLSTEFSRQEYWTGLPCPPPGDLADPGIEPTSPVAPALQVDSLHQESPCVFLQCPILSFQLQILLHGIAWNDSVSYTHTPTHTHTHTASSVRAGRDHVRRTKSRQ